MRSLLVISLLMAGCSTPRQPIPEQPNAPTSPSVVETVGKEWDKADQKVAAAISIARENADKPAVVRGETTVALAYLPPASPEELALARQRAANPADQKAYGDAIEYGKKLLAKLDADFAKLEASQAEAFRVSQLKDARIAELTAEVERVKKSAAENIWTLTGAGLAVIGALTTAFLGPRIGIPLLLCGAFCGGIPYLADSPWFLYLAIGTATVISGLGIYWLWDRVRDSANASDYEPPKA
jgi:hypothetical protein